MNKLLINIVYCVIIITSGILLYQDSVELKNKSNIIALLKEENAVQSQQVMILGETKQLLLSTLEEQHAEQKVKSLIHKDLIREVGLDENEEIEIRSVRLALHMLNHGRKMVEELPDGIPASIFSDIVEASDRLIFLFNNYENERLVIEQRDTLQYVPRLKPETTVVE